MEMARVCAPRDKTMLRARGRGESATMVRRGPVLRGENRSGGIMISRLGHVGIHVRDLEKSKQFYSEVLGLTVTDVDPTLELVFLSARPEVEHHELLLVGGRDAPIEEKLIQQIS